MIARLLAVTGTALIVMSGVSAVAAEGDDQGIPGSFSANVALTSEYFFRGLSQTDDAPALQGGFDYEIELSKPLALYLGVWGSNVDFNEASSVDGATVEIDLYGGLKGSIGETGLGWDAGFIYYTYPSADGSLDYDFVEVQGALSYDFGVASTSVSVNYSSDNFGGSGDALYPKLGVDVPIGKQLTLSGYLAKQFLDKEDVFGQPDYVEWNLGATYNVASFDLNLAYTDTDIDGNPDGADAMVVFTVSRSF
jgi:uncharacterized protein (TIGR02001 family)